MFQKFKNLGRSSVSSPSSKALSSKDSERASGRMDDDDFDEKEEKEEEEEGQKVSRSNSWGLGAKKFMATKTANSSVGRMVIRHFLGDEGNRFLYGIKLAMRKDVGKSKAKHFRNLIFKFALKGKLLSDESKVKKKDVWKMIEPLNLLGLKGYALLKPPPSEVVVDHEEKRDSGRGTRGSRHLRAAPTPPRDIKPALKELRIVHKMTTDLLEPHMRDKNCDALNELFNYIGGNAFVNKLINDKNYREEKSLCFNSLRKMLQPLLETRTYDANMDQICSHPDCDEFCALACGDFNGSLMCAKHHEEEYKEFVNCPTVEHFLSGPGHGYFPFQIQAKKHIDRFSRKLLLSCRKYKEVPEGSRKIAADMISKKYLVSSSHHYVGLEMPGGVREATAEGLHSKEVDLFLPMETFLYRKFVDFFNETFIQTVEFKTYVEETYRLPEFLKDGFNCDDDGHD